VPRAQTVRSTTKPARLAGSLLPFGRGRWRDTRQRWTHLKRAASPSLRPGSGLGVKARHATTTPTRPHQIRWYVPSLNSVDSPASPFLKLAVWHVAAASSPLWPAVKNFGSVSLLHTQSRVVGGRSTGAFSFCRVESDSRAAGLGLAGDYHALQFMSWKAGAAPSAFTALAVLGPLSHVAQAMARSPCTLSMLAEMLWR